MVEQCRACGLLAEMTQPTQLGRARMLGIRNPGPCHVHHEYVNLKGLRHDAQLAARLARLPCTTQWSVQTNKVLSVCPFTTCHRTCAESFLACPLANSTQQWLITGASHLRFCSGPGTVLSYICALVMTYQIHTNKYFLKFTTLSLAFEGLIRIAAQHIALPGVVQCVSHSN